MTLLSASTASDRDRYVPRRTTAYHVHMQMFPACPDPSPCGRPTPDKYVSALLPRCFVLALWNSLSDLATSRRHRWEMARRLSPFLSLQRKDVNFSHRERTMSLHAHRRPVSHACALHFHSSSRDFSAEVGRATMHLQGGIVIFNSDVRRALELHRT